MKTETCKLYSRVFWIFLPNIINIDPYNFKLYRFILCAFLHTCCQDSNFQPQDQDQLQHRVPGPTLTVQKPKSRLHNWLVEKIITHVTEWCAAMKMLIYW